MAFVGCSRAQNSSSTDPKWKATVKVVDEAGRPVAGAEITIGYYVAPPPGQSIAMDKTTGTTDANGVFTTSERSQSVDLVFSARKAGYYQADKSHELGLDYDPARWNPTITLLLKKSSEPIPLFAKRVRSQPPVNETPVGYDLELGDWVAPNGKGRSNDIFFTLHFNKRAENDWDYKLIVSFPNSGDGIQQFAISELEKTSLLRSPHEAPENGYQPQWVKSQTRTPGKPSAYEMDQTLNFFFRTRTILDERGNVKRANYGKIYGDFMDFQYYYNPESNSRDLEFDPTRNLFKNLPFVEQVKKP